MKAIIAMSMLSITVAAQAQTVTIFNPVIKGKIATATITTPTDDRLEGLSAPLGIAMLHAVKRSGMYRSAIPTKANTPRRLSGHGYHIMVMHPLPKGSEVPMTLIFKNAGAIKVIFKVI